MSIGMLGRVYAKGEYIVRQGDVCNCMYVVQTGQVEVLRENNDGDVRIGVMSAGDYFGEMSIFEGGPCSASLRALREARVLSINKENYIRYVQENPALAFTLLKAMSHRIRMITEENTRMNYKASEN